MTNNEPESNLQHQIIPPPQPSEPTANDTSIASNPHPARKPDATMSEPTGHPPSAKTIGAVGGGVAGDKLAESIDLVSYAIEPTMGLKLGANDAPVNLPAHYTWTELQALSKPQR